MPPSKRRTCSRFNSTRAGSELKSGKDVADIELSPIVRRGQAMHLLPLLDISCMIILSLADNPGCADGVGIT